MVCFRRRVLPRGGFGSGPWSLGHVGEVGSSARRARGVAPRMWITALQGHLGSWRSGGRLRAWEPPPKAGAGLTKALVGGRKGVCQKARGPLSQNAPQSRGVAGRGL